MCRLPFRRFVFVVIHFAEDQVVIFEGQIVIVIVVDLLQFVHVLVRKRHVIVVVIVVFCHVVVAFCHVIVVVIVVREQDQIIVDFVGIGFGFEFRVVFLRCIEVNVIIVNSFVCLIVGADSQQTIHGRIVVVVVEQQLTSEVRVVVFLVHINSKQLFSEVIGTGLVFFVTAHRVTSFF